MLDVRLHTHNMTLDEHQSEHARRHVTMALDRFDKRIPEVNVRLSDREHAKTRCQIDIPFRTHALRADVSDRDAMVALAKVTHIISTSVERALERERTMDNDAF